MDSKTGASSIEFFRKDKIMLVRIKDLINEKILDSVKNSRDKEVKLDLEQVEDLTVKEINKILVITRVYNKKVVFINCNPRITKTLKVLT